MGRVISMVPEERIQRLKARNEELEKRVAVLERQLESARNLACRRLEAYGREGMVKLTPDGDG